jgi:hypothetical protein
LHDTIDGLSIQQLRAAPISVLMRSSGTAFRSGSLHSPNFAAGQADLDAMRVAWRAGEYLVHHAASPLARGLVLFLDNLHGDTRMNILPALAVHRFILQDAGHDSVLFPI